MQQRWLLSSTLFVMLIIEAMDPVFGADENEDRKTISQLLHFFRENQTGAIYQISFAVKQ